VQLVGHGDEVPEGNRVGVHGSPLGARSVGGARGDGGSIQASAGRAGPDGTLGS
jgi:hypothetical protein